jgi:hypothetical protein
VKTNHDPLEYFWLQINLKVFLAMGVAVAQNPFLAELT